MPNIFSCSTEWFDKLSKEQPKVIIATWKEGSDKVNEWLEKLQKLEGEGVPVFVVDTESCPAIAEKLGATEGGETIVFEHGEEKGRVTPGEDLEADLGKVRELAKESLPIEERAEETTAGCPTCGQVEDLGDFLHRREKLA